MGVYRDFGLHLSAQRISYGDTLSITIDFVTTARMEIGLALIALGPSGGIQEAQADVTDALRTLPQGQGSCHFEIGPLHLRNGHYKLSLTLLDPTRKAVLLHALDCAELDIDGPLGFGVSYQLPLASASH